MPVGVGERMAQQLEILFNTHQQFRPVMKFRLEAFSCQPVGPVDLNGSLLANSVPAQAMSSFGSEEVWPWTWQDHYLCGRGWEARPSAD
jgi:hypothetical protein